MAPHVKSGGCLACHQLGTKATREFPPSARHVPTSAAAWERRVQSGQAGAQMTRRAQSARPRSARSTMFADWTDRIAAGEVPPAPPRPQGIERNVVITEWDWADPKAYLHDEVSTDRRNPDAQRQRADLRIARTERRLSAGARSPAQHASARCS